MNSYNSTSSHNENYNYQNTYTITWWSTQILYKSKLILIDNQNLIIIYFHE